MMHRHVRTGLFAMAFTFAAAGAAQAQDTLTAPQVRAQLEAQGFTNVHDVKFDDGMWEADATSADGKRTELRLDPRTGTVYPDTTVSQLSEADIRAKLSTAGYGNVHDVKFDDGMWKADAKASNGRNVEVKLDPMSGEIIAEERD
ncbi:PepSY domain-containing protein [Stenotrophomonas humi]